MQKLSSHIEVNLIIRDFENDDEVSVIKLCRDSFMKFVEPTFSRRAKMKAIEKFKKGRMLLDIANGYRTRVATIDGIIVGVIQFKTSGHISMLYINEGWQRMGIATRLISDVQAIVLLANPNGRILTVNSSMYAFDFYKKLGFHSGGETETTPENTIPMVKEIIRSEFQP